MKNILRKAKDYKRLAFQTSTHSSHTNNPYAPPSQTIPAPKPTKKSPSDITNYDKQQTVPIPEAIPY